MKNFKAIYVHEEQQLRFERLRDSGEATNSSVMKELIDTYYEANPQIKEPKPKKGR